MKRLALSLFGIALMVSSTGCCLFGGGCGSPCGSPCGPCGSSGGAYYGGGGGGCPGGACGAAAAYPQGAFYNGGSAAQATAYNAPAYGVTQTAMAPIQALPTF